MSNMRLGRNRLRQTRWQPERGEVASWLILAAGLAAAAVLASSAMGRITGSLTDNVAAAAQVEVASSSGLGPGGGSAALDALALGEDLGEGEGSAKEITLNDGTTAILRRGPDGRVALVSADADGTLRVVHVDADGTVVQAEAQATHDDESGWSLTDWHFEGRDDLNTNLPETVAGVEGDDGWTELTADQSIFHDDPTTPEPERKFIHTDGREAIYNPETGQLVTDPRYAGTYNYVNPAPMPESITDIGGWFSWTFRGIGHGVTDVLPYFFGGNVRGPDPEPDPVPAPVPSTGGGGGGGGGGGWSNSLTDADDGPSVCGSCSDSGGGGYDNPDLDGHPSAAG